jgi:hypothetical protein
LLHVGREDMPLDEVTKIIPTTVDSVEEAWSWI